MFWSSLSGCFRQVLLQLKTQVSLVVIKLEFIDKLTIKCNDWLLADKCVRKQPIMRFILSLRLYSSFITSKTESRRLHNWGTTFTSVSGSMIVSLFTRVSFFAKFHKNKIRLDISEFTLPKYLANLLDMKWLCQSNFVQSGTTDICMWTCEL